MTTLSATQESSPRFRSLARLSNLPIFLQACSVSMIGLAALLGSEVTLAQSTNTNSRSQAAVRAASDLRASKSIAELSKAGWEVDKKVVLKEGVKEDWLVKHASGIYGVCASEGRAAEFKCNDVPDSDPGWSIIQFADFDGDGNADLLWQGPKGELDISRLFNLSIASDDAVADATNERVTHAVDLDGDGKSDIVWISPNGDVYVWLMDGSKARKDGLRAVTGKGKAWQVVYAGLLDKENARGRATLLLRQKDGSAAIWRETGFVEIGARGTGISDATLISLIDNPMPAKSGYDFAKVAPTCGIAATYFGASNEVAFTGSQPYAATAGQYLVLRNNCDRLRWETAFVWTINGVVQPAYTGNLWVPVAPLTAGLVVYYTSIATHNGETTPVPSFVSFRIDGSSPAVPGCSSLGASPTSATPGQNITLSLGGCTNSPNVYEWRLGGTLFAVTETASLVVPAPQTAGSHTFNSAARNGSGVSSGINAVVTVTSTNAPPNVSITSPSNNLVTFRGTPLAVNASASDADGTVAKVELFGAGFVLDTKTATPYAFNITPTTVGDGTLTARATDNQGGVKTSLPTVIKVSAPFSSPGFENPVVTTGTVAWTQTSSSWWGGGTYGIATSGYLTGQSRPAAPEGTQAAVIAHSYGYIAQAPYWAAGTYTVTAKVLSENAGGVLKVFVDGTEAGSAALTANSWTTVTFPGIQAATGKYYTISFSSGSSSVAGYVYIDDVAVTAYVNPPPTISISSPNNGAMLTAPANVSFAVNASDTNGSITKVDFFNGSALLHTATAPPYTYAWNSVPGGNYTLTAIATDNEGASTTSAPVSITVSGSANQPPAVSLSAPANNAVFTAPASLTLTATASDADGTISKVEFYNGPTLLDTDTSAPYSFAWTGVTPGTYVLTAKATDNVGAVTTSAPITITVNSTFATFQNGGFENPSVSGSPWANTTIPNWVGLGQYGIAPSAWFVNAMGLNAPPEGAQAGAIQRQSGALKQTLYLDPGSYSLKFNVMADNSMTNVRVRRNGVDVHTQTLNYNQWVEVTVPGIQVATAGNQEFVFSAGDPISAGGMYFDNVRILSGAGNLPPTVALTAPINQSTFTAPAPIALSATASDPDGTISKVEFFQGSILLGTATSPPYTMSWTGMASGTYVITAKATDNYGLSTASATSVITVNAANANPTALILTPTNGSSFTQPANFVIEADASDTDGQIVKVEFYNGTTKLGEAGGPTGPYIFNWVQAPQGSHSITAKAIDNAGGVGTSPAITVLVGVTNTNPTVQLTTPANNASFVSPATINLAATAADSDGTISKVEFFNGATLLWADTTAPYSFSWTNVPTGTYTLTARATDNANGVTISAPVTVTVGNNSPPTVALTAPTNNASFGSSATIEITANASDSDGTISKVEFFQGATLIGTDTTAPYSFSWTNVPAGTYTLTARATDNGGAVTTSASRTITVTQTLGLLNPSFELPQIGYGIYWDAQIPNWTAYNTYGLVSAAYLVDTNYPQPPNGNQAFVMDDSNGYLAQSFNTIGGTHQLQISAMSTSGGHAWLYLNGEYWGTIYALAQQWDVSAFSFSLPAGTHQIAVYAAQSGAGLVYLDNFVLTPPNAPPVVSLTSPAAGATFTAPATVTLTADASDAEGPVSKVEFYRAGSSTPIATVLNSGTGFTAPGTFTASWTNVAAGNYTITAKAYDSANLTTTSSSRNITVTVNSGTVFVGGITAGTTPQVGSALPLSTTVANGSNVQSLVYLIDGGTINATLSGQTYSASWTPAKEGAYLIKAVATLTSGAQATIATQIVVARTPNATALSIPSPTSSAGALAGSLGVSDMGGAQFTIPISLPPGIAGMVPGLALAYSSQGGNGHLGTGWSLSGLSAITRCPKTIAQDGAREGINYDDLTDNDAFCIDGQRMIPVATTNGTTVQGAPSTATIFRTELDRFDRIEGYTLNNDTEIRGFRNFRVYAKNGQILEYSSRWWVLNVGNLQTSQDPNRVNTVRLWTLDKVSDRHGNYYLIDYSGTRPGVDRSAPVQNSAARVAPVGSFPQGEHYPTQVIYTLNDSPGTAVTQVNRAVFEYEDRPSTDRHVLFDSGAGQFTLSKRLKTIKVYLDGDLPPANSGYSSSNPYPAYCGGSSGTNCGTLVRTYTLNYQQGGTSRSRITSIQECAADGVCLPATTFAWTDSTYNLNGTGSGLVSVGAADVNNFHELRVADIDGDGRSDLYRRYGSSPGHVQVFLSQADGSFIERRLYPTGGGEFAGPTNTSWTALDFNGDGRADFFSVNLGSYYMRLCITNAGATAITCSSPNDPTPQNPNGVAGPHDGVYLQGDFDGDGKVDLLLYRGVINVSTNTDMHGWDLLLGSASGTFATARRIYTPYRNQLQNGTGYFDATFAMVGDFNGDGRADLLMRKVPDQCLYGSGQGGDPCIPNNQIFSWQVFLSTPDLTGNTGFVWNAREVNLENTQYRRKYQTTVDFNGDGLADVLTQDRVLCLSGGDGSFGSYETVAANPPAGYTSGSLCGSARSDPTFTQDLPAVWNNVNFDEIILGDFDGDGRTDMLLKRPNSIGNVCLSRSASGTNPPVGNNVYFECSDWALATNEAFNNLKAGDFNGDGKTDLVSSAGGAGIMRAFAGNATSPVGTGGRMLPDMLVRVTNGLGAYTDIEYAPLTSPATYTKGSAATNGNVDIQSPMYVVRQTRSSTSVAGTTFDTNYRYEGLVATTDGRGLLGFRKRIVEHYNGAATVRTETEYEQDWWQAGRVKTVSKFIDGVLVNQASNEYNYRHPTSTIGPLAVAQKIRQVHLLRTEERSWNLTAAGQAQALPYTVTTTPLSAIDEYGHVGTVRVDTFDPATGQSDRYSKVTTSTYHTTANYLNKWLLGRLSAATVTHTKPGGPDITRASSFSYNTNTGQLETEEVEPGANNSDLWLKKTYTYDVYGNGKRVTSDFREYNPSNGALQNATSRYVESTYGTDGRFVASVQNALGHTETRTYDRRFGGVATVTDANGLFSQTTYDAFGRKIAEQLTASSAGGAPLMAMGTTTYVAGATTVMVENRSHTGGFSTTTMDNLGRETTSSTRNFGGGLSTSTTAYDQYGRRIWSSGPKGGTIANNGTARTDTFLTLTLEYDKLGRVTNEIVRAGNNNPSGTELTRTTTSYNVEVDSAGTAPGTRMAMMVTQTGAQYGNHTVKKLADSQGRTRRVVDNANGSSLYDYDATGNLTDVTGPGSIRETMQYDTRGRKTFASNDNLGGSYSYFYSGAGELNRQTDPKSQVTTQQYDVLGRLTTRVEGGANGFTTTWSHDCTNAKGKTCSVTNAQGGAAAGATGATHTTHFDPYSRPVRVVSQIDGQSHERHSLYNPQGQLSYVGYPHAQTGNGAATRLEQGIGLRHGYNAYGFHSQTTDDAGNILASITDRYLDGQIAAGVNGPLNLIRTYDNQGRPLRRSMVVTGSVALDNTTSFDALGNLVTRGQTDNTTSPWTESFCVDNLNRLRNAAINTTPDCNGAANFTYSADGNLTTKTGAITGAIGTLNYGSASRPNGAGPHAVASATINGSTRTYTYDNNGNLTGDGLRTLTYTPFNLPTTITGTNPGILSLGNANSVTFDHDGEHARIKEVGTLNGTPDTNPAHTIGTTTTIYVGAGFFERIAKPDGSTDFKHYLSGPDGTFGVLTRTIAADATSTSPLAPPVLRYWHKDHLGSPVAEYGTTSLTPLSYDSWGLRRNPYNTTNAAINGITLSAYASSRGYTGHTHLDEVGLIHMNGRLYDPLLGRFLQADPVIQEPYNSQNFNRYSYVLNSPLTHTDPSGYSFWTEVRRPVGAAIATWVLGPGGMLGEFGIAGTLGVPNAYAATVSSLAAGFAAGGIGGGNIQSAVRGAFTAGLLDGIGLLNLPLPEKIIAHAIAGCVGAGINGGSCEAGAFAGAAGAAVPTTSSGLLNVMMKAVVGGTAARLAGGKFVNGAFTASFNYLLNDRNPAHDKAATLAENKISGLGAEDARLAQLAERGLEVQRHVKISLVIDGKIVSAVADFVYWEHGRLILEEVKHGDGSRLSKAQQILYKDAMSAGRLSIVSSEVAGTLRVAAGTSLVEQKITSGAKLTAPETSRAARQWGRLVGGAISVLGSPIVMGIDLLSQSGNLNSGGDCIHAGCYRPSK